MTNSNVTEFPMPKKWPTEQVGDCIVWRGGLVHNGYGILDVKGKTWLAHRYAYSMAFGRIPDGLHLDHLCRNRPCVNPAHLEAVTQAENNRRQAEANWATRCRRGHERTAENTAIEAGFRRCLTCRREKALETNQRYHARHPGKRNEMQRAYRARLREEREAS